MDNLGWYINLKQNLMKMFIMQRDALLVYLENVGHPGGKMIKQVEPMRLEMPWQTKHNVIDCGTFLMRHMETYKGVTGNAWKCGFSNECTDAGEITYSEKKLMILDISTLQSFF
ncbi:hypothetical protein Hanom_Chr17g01583671 [Helianthus anomalus]